MFLVILILVAVVNIFSGHLMAVMNCRINLQFITIIKTLAVFFIIGIYYSTGAV